MRNSRRKLILVTGMVGSGKSTIGEEVWRSFTGKLPIIVLDPLLEYEGKVFYTFSEFAASYNPNGKEIYICRFTPTLTINKRGEQESHQVDVIKLMLTVRRFGNCLLVVDESETYLEDKEVNSYFYPLLKQGRHWRVSLVCISQRMVDFDTSLRSQFTTLITLKQYLPEDIERLEKFGFDYEQIKALPLFVYGKNVKDYCLVLGQPIKEVSEGL